MSPKVNIPNISSKMLPPVAPPINRMIKYNKEIAKEVYNATEMDDGYFWSIKDVSGFDREFVSDTLYSFDPLLADLFSQFSNVNINCAVYNVYIRAPNLFQ